MQTHKNAWVISTKMDKEINLIIKEGVYCSWCADLMKKTLRQRFAIKEVEIDVLKEKVHIVTYKHVSPESIIVFLKDKGYQLIEEKGNLLH